MSRCTLAERVGGQSGQRTEGKQALHAVGSRIHTRLSMGIDGEITKLTHISDYEPTTPRLTREYIDRRLHGTRIGVIRIVNQ